MAVDRYELTITVEHELDLYAGAPVKAHQVGVTDASGRWRKVPQFTDEGVIVPSPSFSAVADQFGVARLMLPASVDSLDDLEEASEEGFWAYQLEIAGNVVAVIAMPAEDTEFSVEMVIEPGPPLPFLGVATGPAGADGVGIPVGGTTGQVFRKASDADFDGVFATLVKADVGLGNVDNTSDVGKPVSTAQLAALDLKAPLTTTVGTSLSTTGTVNLDLSTLNGTYQTITLTGNPTFTTSNLTAGRQVTLIIAAGGSGRTIAYPAWVAVGPALPTSLASGKTLVVTLVATSTTDASVVASAAVQL